MEENEELEFKNILTNLLESSNVISDIKCKIEMVVDLSDDEEKLRDQARAAIEVLDVSTNSKETSKKGQIIGCRLCDKKYVQTLTYENHWEKNHKNVNPKEMYDNPELCKICDRYFQNFHGLKTHISVWHKSVRIDEALHNSTAISSQPSASNNRITSAISSVVNRISQSSLSHDLDAITKSTKSARNRNPVYPLTSEILNAPSTSSSALKRKTPNELSTPTSSLSTKPNRKSLVCSKCGYVCSDENSLASHVLSMICDRNPIGPAVMTMNMQSFQLYPLTACSSSAAQQNSFIEDAQIRLVNSDLGKITKVEHSETSLQDDCSLINSNAMVQESCSTMKMFHGNDTKMINSANHQKRRKIFVNCRICGLSCCDSRAYRNHFRKCHATYSADEMYDDSWKCAECSEVFKNQIGLFQHFVQRHKGTPYTHNLNESPHSVTE